MTAAYVSLNIWKQTPLQKEIYIWNSVALNKQDTLLQKMFDTKYVSNLLLGSCQHLWIEMQDV